MNDQPSQPRADQTTPASLPPIPTSTPQNLPDVVLPAQPPALPPGPSERAIVPTRRMATTSRALAQYSVVLHDDEHVEMTYVVRSIVELTPLSAPLARDAMLAAHEHGSAVMLVTHLERAELYVQQFNAKGLTVSLEPMG